MKNIKHFFVTLTAILKDIGLKIKLKYNPLAEYQITYSFNDTERHCPKTEEDVKLIFATINELFTSIKSTQLFNSLIMEIQFANMPSCRTWETGNVMTLPTYLDAPFDNIITREADRISTTYWVLEYADGNVEVVQPHQNRGVFRTGNQIVVIKDSPDCMPDNVVSAIQVTLGVVQSSNNTLRGFQWKLYR